MFSYTLLISHFNKIRFINRLKRGFTLVEVLITLTVIGVISVLVIPALIVNMEKAEIAAQVIKYQSVLSQAVSHVKTEYGGSILTSPLNTDQDNAAGWNALKKYLNVVKDCETTTGLDCWANVTYKALDNDDWVNFNNYLDAGRGILQDGSSIDYEAKTNCRTNRSSTGTGRLYNSNCALIFIDVNGPKQPNKNGRDVFAWYIMSDGTVYPQGILDDTSGTIASCPTAGTGRGCTAKVIKEGKITY